MAQAEETEKAQEQASVRFMMTITAEDEYARIEFGKTVEELVENPPKIDCSSPEFALLALFSVL